MEIGALPARAAGELLTLQRAAYVTEAQLYDDARLPALVQTLDELRAELVRCLVAQAGRRLVAPCAPGRRTAWATLFTGHLSTANLRLYERHGYRESRRERVHAGLDLVHLDKDLA
ncbi:GNAT family N-acetyltransferase [Blastococcus sp. TF02-09]|nr:GNAT family N-acetyltransferase [Blastococcus sp. TF02-9]